MKITITPPKLPPIPISPRHQRSLDKSKAINQKVESFVKSNFKDSPFSSEEKMAGSSASLSNTKAFFESEIKLIMKMVEQSNKLYKQKEDENEVLQKILKEAETKIAQLQKAAIESTVNKSQNQKSGIDENDERKTRKKQTTEDAVDTKGLIRTTSEFTLDRAYDRLQSQWKNKYEQLERRLQEEIKKEKRRGDSLEQKIKKQQQMTLKAIQKQNVSERNASNNKIFLNELQKQNRELQSQYDLLQTRYTELEDKHGQTVAEYEIKLNNLKSLLAGVNQKASPEKNSQKKPQGYYSINRPLARNESQESLESFTSSKYTPPSHAQINLKEENQYLRTQLIRVLDEKGSLQMKVNKYKKLAIKYETLAKSVKESQQQFSSFQNQNSQFLSNLQKGRQTDRSGKSFKKKRQTSVLLVQGTEKKHQDILQDQKITKLVKEIASILNSNKQNEFTNQQQSNVTQIEFLEKVLATLKQKTSQLKAVDSLMKKLSDEKQALEKEKMALEEKSKKDVSDLRRYLKDSNLHLATPKSEDSTDKAFKHIKLIEIHGESSEEEAIDFNGFSKSMLGHKSQSVASQRNEVKLLKEKIASLQQTISNLEKLNMNAGLENRIVPYSASSSRKIQHESKLAEYHPFDFFEQKITEFYQNTLQQLNDWKKSALDVQNSFNQLPQIQQEQHETSSHFQISKIVRSNILRMSQEFESIKNSSFDRSTVFKNEEYAKNVFGDQKMSRSFIKSESSSPSQTFEDLINKKLEDFQQFSSKWVEKYDKKTSKNQDSNSSQRPIEIPPLLIKNGAAKDKLAVQDDSFKLDLDEIDAKSDYILSDTETKY